jgi:DNA-binding SARP family transcriptional activator
MSLGDHTVETVESTGPIIRVFGGAGVEVDGETVDIGGPRQRRLLALLTTRAGEVVSNDWLSEYVWDDRDRPEATVPALRTYVSRLRSSFPETIRNSLEDLDWAHAEISRLQLDRLELLEERWEVELALGRHTEITGELAAFTAEHALRERAVRQYALALHRSGRSTEALRVIADHRRVVAEANGLDPSLELAELEDAALCKRRTGRSSASACRRQSGCLRSISSIGLAGCWRPA